MMTGQVMVLLFIHAGCFLYGDKNKEVPLRVWIEDPDWTPQEAGMIPVPPEERSKYDPTYWKMPPGKPEQEQSRPAIAGRRAGWFPTESVTFRHADANVMAQLLPALDPPRYARLFGPATHILFAPHHEWGADCVVARNVTAAMNVTPARGTLHWDPKIRNAIRDRRIAVFKTRVAAYLKDVAPERVEAIEPSAFTALLSRAMKTATDLGITSEAGYCRLGLA